MSKVQMLRAFVNRRLTAAAEEILVLFERTIAEYEEEIDRQRRLLQDGHGEKPEIRADKAVYSANVKKLMVIKEVPPEQEWSSTLDQKDPESPHIKEEQEELLTSQEGEQLKEADVTKFTFTSVPLKNEDDGEKPQSSQLHQRLTEDNTAAENSKTEADGEDCGGSETARNSDPDRHLQPVSHYDSFQFYKHVAEQSDNEQSNDLKCNTVKKSFSCSECGREVCDREVCESSEPARNRDPDRHLQPASNKTSSSSETEDSNDRWKQSREPQSGLNDLNNSQVPVSDVGYNAAKKSFSCSGCGKRFGNKDHLQIHMKCHAGEKTFTCPFCGKKFTKRSNLTTHLRVHTGEKPFTCSVCNTSFSLRCTLVNHMRVHTGEKPFSCSVCSKRFSKKANLNTHMALHTEEKPFKCGICDKRFTWHSQVKNHKCVVDSSR